MKRKLACVLLAGLFGAPLLAQEVDLRVAGDDEVLTEILRDAALTRQLDDDARPAEYIAAARADYARMLAGLYGEGYHGGVISIRIDGAEAAAISPLARLRDIQQVVIEVQPGPQFTFGDIGIAPLTPQTELPEDFVPGATARTEVVRDATRAAVRGWRRDGYAKAAAADQQIVALHPQERLDVAVRIAPGPRLTFGDVTVTGTDRMRPERVRAIAGLPEGEVFDPDEVDLATDRLRRTGVFGSVALREADRIASGDRLPITIQVAERAPRRIRFGAEISSIEGLRLTGSWLHRNLFGGAERFEVGAEVSGLGNDVMGDQDDGTDTLVYANFDRPATFGPNADLYIATEYEERDDPELYFRQVSIEGGVSYIFSEELSASVGVGLRQGLTRDDLGERDYTLLTLPASVTWDLRNDRLNATDGYYLSADATPFLALAGGDNGLHLTGDARGYFGFGEEDRFVLAVRGQIGSLLGPDIADAPGEFLFYSGGGGTVRGHEFQSLGAEVDGVEVGGRSLAVASAEARFQIRENIGVVGFYDVGFVSADSDFSEGESHAGAGVGIRYNTGLGPIRFDVATPVSGDGSGVQYYIGIGQAF